jgi:hypothetical protein
MRTPGTTSVDLTFPRTVTTREGFAVTVSVAVPDVVVPVAVAVIVAEPAATPVAMPLVGPTVAINVSLLVQSKVMPVMTSPAAFLATPVNGAVPRTATEAVEGVTVTVATVTSAMTVIGAVPRILVAVAVAVMVAEPAVTPVAIPVTGSTEALIVLDQSKVILGMINPCKFLATAVKGDVALPTTTFAAGAVTVTLATMVSGSRVALPNRVVPEIVNVPGDVVAVIVA